MGGAKPEDTTLLGLSLEAGRVRTPTQAEKGVWGQAWMEGRGGLGLRRNSKRRRGLELGLGWGGLLVA